MNKMFEYLLNQKKAWFAVPMNFVYSKDPDLTDKENEDFVTHTFMDYCGLSHYYLPYMINALENKENEDSEPNSVAFLKFMKKKNEEGYSYIFQCGCTLWQEKEMKKIVKVGNADEHYTGNGVKDAYPSYLKYNAYRKKIFDDYTLELCLSSIKNFGWNAIVNPEDFAKDYSSVISGSMPDMLGDLFYAVMYSSLDCSENVYWLGPLKKKFANACKVFDARQLSMYQYSDVKNVKGVNDNTVEKVWTAYPDLFWHWKFDALESRMLKDMGPKKWDTGYMEKLFKLWQRSEIRYAYKNTHSLVFGLKMNGSSIFSIVMNENGSMSVNVSPYSDDGRNIEQYMDAVRKGYKLYQQLKNMEFADVSALME